MNAIMENQLGIAMLVSVLGMFAVTFLCIYIDILDRRAAEAAAHESRIIDQETDK